KDAFQANKGGLYDAFIAKLSPDGARLVYSSYLGGTRSGTSPITGWDGASGIALDAVGNAYISGYSQSDDFPTTPNAFQAPMGGGICAFLGPPCRDAFVAKVTAGGPGVLPPISLGAAPLEVAPGGTITATWAGLGAPTAEDVLRLYALGAKAGPGDEFAAWSTRAA